MAYNAISGTILAANDYTPGDLIIGNIVSGNLSTSDGSSITYVPRVGNATNNALITNVGGDANDLTCESNLTFDGSALSITGELTASTGLSASYLMGDGSRLTGIATGGGGSGGIFTTPSAVAAYTTSSINIGSSATPSHTLSVVGISQLSGGIVHQRVHKTTNYSITTSDYYIGVDSAGGAVTLTLPAAAAALDGQTWMVKDEGGAANSNNIIITGSGVDAETIEGANQIVLESPYASVQVYCNGVTKFFVC
jgi:hypothetical protein